MADRREGTGSTKHETNSYVLIVEPVLPQSRILQHSINIRILLIIGYIT